jgi:nicotinamide riboside transporter PnuC
MESIVLYFITGIFGLAILGKLTGKTKSTFDKAGYKPYFMYCLALAELVLTIGLFTEYAFYSIIGLLAIMLGAIFTLFRQKAKPQQYILSIVAVSLLVTLYCF